MASAGPQKKMVSSVFITLASPFRATVTPTAHLHSSPTREQRRRSSAAQEGWTGSAAPISPLYARPTAAPCRRDSTHTPDAFVSSCPDAPPPPHDSEAGEEPVGGAIGSSPPPAGAMENDVCGFCRKPVLLSEPAIAALNRTYHAACFLCRQCHAPLAAKLYYNKSGIPLCEDCYQASLEPCWACGDVIKDRVIRALERAYHPPCFVCTTCRQPIGEQRFAQGEVGEVYCLQDYYRKYAPQCRVCAELIIPRDDGTDSFTVECLGHSYHEDCYRCEVCRALLSPEPNERGCHPLDGQILCKPCHVTLIQRASL
ncbi:filamin-binding LIM protein 1 isoform X2 [Pseudorasbora parva]